MYIAGVGCSSGSGFGTSLSAPTKSAFIDAYCTALSSCCGVEQLPTDGAQCHEQLKATPGTYDATTGQACLDAMKSAAAADPSWCVSSNATPACTNVLAAINLNPGHTGGTRGKAGDACTVSLTPEATGYAPTFSGDSDTFCSSDDGLYCDPSSNTCTAIVAAGGSCVDSPACGSESDCHPIRHDCEPRSKIGDSCAAGACIPGVAYCDKTESCVADIAGGGACTQSGQCASGFCDGATCRASMSGNVSNLNGLQVLCGGPSGS